VAKVFRIFLISNFRRFLNLVYVLFGISPASHRAFEDGPDRGFQNVGKTHSDAGAIPKRTYTKFFEYVVHRVFLAAVGTHPQNASLQAATVVLQCQHHL
jgi:hypothetical protein